MTGIPEVDCVVFHSNWMLESEEGERKPVWRDALQPSGDVTLGPFYIFLIRDQYARGGVFRTAALNGVNGYDERFHLWAYWDLWLRQAERGFRIVCVPEPILDRIQTPLSDGQTMSNLPRWRDEFNEVVLGMAMSMCGSGTSVAAIFH